MRDCGLCLIGIAIVLCLAECTNQERPRTVSEFPSFQRPSNATARIEGQQFPFCLWYNPQQWMIWNTPFGSGNDVIEWHLALIEPKERVSIGRNTKISGSAATHVYADVDVTENEFRSIISNHLMKTYILDKIVDLQSDERIVNGIKVYAWNFTFKPVGQKAHTAFVYFYSDGYGSVSVMAHTLSEEWEHNKQTIIDLLNGFCLLRS